jgi:flagellar biosynthesis/type III secretory pathway protein FliH
MTVWAPSDELLREANAEASVLAKGYRGAYAKAYTEGFVKGFIEGYAQGVRRSLGIILSHQLGALTPEQEARLQAASLDTLDRWTSRALTAPSIDAALQDSSEAQ